MIYSMLSLNINITRRNTYFYNRTIKYSIYFGMHHPNKYGLEYITVYPLIHVDVKKCQKNRLKTDNKNIFH